MSNQQSVPTPHDRDLTGKTFVVTGASTGVGLETARALAKRGATIAMASRDATRGKTALEEVRASSGNDALEFFPVDLSSMADTRRRFAEYAKPMENTSWFPKEWNDAALAQKCWGIVEKLTGTTA